MTVRTKLILVVATLSMVFPVTGYTYAVHSMMHKNLAMENVVSKDDCHIKHEISRRKNRKVKHHKKKVSYSCSKHSSARGHRLIGSASWYGPGFHGRRTASGERFNQYDFTAAHKTLPLGTRVKVTNLSTDESVIVRINDRGPFVRGRIIDLSKGAARAIGMNGTTLVEIAKVD